MTAVLLATRDPEIIRLCQETAALAEVPLQVIAEPAQRPHGQWLLLGSDLAGAQPPVDERVRVVTRTPAEAGSIELPRQSAELHDLLITVDPTAPQRAHVVAVTAVSGGLGASTLAIGLGLVRADSWVVDADPFGPGLEVSAGVEHLPGVRWPDLIRSTGELPGRRLGEQLPRIGPSRLLSWRPDQSASRTAELTVADRVAAVLRAGRRTAARVVLDLPSAGLLSTVPDLVVVLVGPSVASVAAAHRLREVLPALVVPVCARPASGWRVPEADVARVLGQPPVATWVHRRGFAAGADRGELLTALGSGRAHRWLQDLSRLLDQVLADAGKR